MKKTLNFLDALILILALWIFHDLDFNNLNLFDKIYIGTFGIWFVLFILRIIIVLRKKIAGRE